MSEEITTVSWWARIKDAFMGILVGIILIVIAVILSFWNERHSAQESRSLIEAKKAMVTIPTTPVDIHNNLKVVYMTGFANTQDELTDADLGVSQRAISLNRNVEMYQWQEKVERRKESQTGGSQKEITTYSYNKIWAPNPIDSSNFNDESNHKNPQSMGIQSDNQYANTVSVGDFILPDELIRQMANGSLVNLDKVNTKTLETRFSKPISVNNTILYAGKDSNNPEIGDLRITLMAVPPQNVSIIGQQNGNTLQPYQAEAGESVIMLSSGTISGHEMINKALADNATLTWILRAMSLAMMVGGFALLMQPLVILADVLPFLGSIVGFSTGIAAMILGLSLWTLITAVAWFTSRPLVSIILIGIVVALVYGLNKRKQMV